MMGQRHSPGVNQGLFGRKAEQSGKAGSEDGFLDIGAQADEDDDGGGSNDWSVQRKRRHGNKPPWLRHRSQDDRLDS
jgi:hypothetical protein